jgi:hypothetical protein
MILEDILQTVLSSLHLSSLTIPEQYMNALSQVIDIFGSLEYILPVNTALSCIAFIFTFSLVCGIIKVVLFR